jgi:hypothetical protein
MKTTKLSHSLVTYKTGRPGLAVQPISYSVSISQATKVTCIPSLLKMCMVKISPE